ncbi:MAG: phage virion morphogenesis protein, partial [Robiginitomaculum sp.]|nr:phage virion morphogenesis protein [Robiginitomaculum sp.]
MSGVALHIDVSDLGLAADRLEAIAGQIDLGVITAAVAGSVESQTKRRISDEKTSPDGDPWAAWSAAYAGTRHSGHSLLQGEGDLLDGIFSEQRGDKAVVGSNEVYAAIHQFGGKAGRNKSIDIPARPFLGISEENEADIMAD